MRMNVPGMRGVPQMLAIRILILPVLALFLISWKAMAIYFSLTRLEHEKIDCRRGFRRKNNIQPSSSMSIKSVLLSIANRATDVKAVF